MSAPKARPSWIFGAYSSSCITSQSLFSSLNGFRLYWPLSRATTAGSCACSHGVRAVHQKLPCGATIVTTSPGRTSLWRNGPRLWRTHSAPGGLTWMSSK